MHRYLSIVGLYLTIVSLVESRAISDILNSTTWILVERKPFLLAEGPVWSAMNSSLLFSDVSANAIYALNPNLLPSTVFRQPSNNTNGLAFDSKGRLIMCEAGGRRITRLELTREIVTLADNYQGQAFNSPNDLAVRGNDIYFTDPVYGTSNETRELAFKGVYRVTEAGVVELIANDFVSPNGIAFSPDFKTLYVCDTGNNSVRSFTLSANGTADTGRVLISSISAPDGMKVDSRGNLYFATSVGIQIFSSSGTSVGVVSPPTGALRATNLCFGGQDFKTIFITTTDAVYKIQGLIAGNGVVPVTASTGEGPIINSTQPVFSSTNMNPSSAPLTQMPTRGTEAETNNTAVEPSASSSSSPKGSADATTTVTVTNSGAMLSIGISIIMAVACAVVLL